VFDSSLLKESINSLIASGKRNFAIDMSPLDYIYSDTINILMAMNKRVLDVTGRLSLMAPQPEVLQILKRAGIHNILRIFETETELMKSSEDMILQTTSIKLSDVNAAIKQATPESEFDQLRSEIGSVFGSTQAAPQPQQQPQAPQGRAGSEDEFNQMFQQFETNAPASGGGMPPQVQQPQPQAPRFAPRPVQQPAAQPIPLRPAAPAYPKPLVEQPKFAPEHPSVRAETQRFAAAPAASQFQDQRSAEPTVRDAASFDVDAFEAAPREKPAAKTRFREDFDTFDDDRSGDEELHKKSPVPVLVIVLLIVALLGAGGFIVYSTMLKKKTETVATVAPNAVQQPTAAPAAPPPQLPVETSTPAPVTPPPASEEVKAPEPPKEIVESKPDIPPAPRRSAPKPAVRKSSPPPARTEPKPAVPTNNQVVFNTTPSGAAIIINDQRVGTTPFTWTKPFFGNINVQVTKPGYKTLQKSFEFTGGSAQESYSLEKEVAVAPPPPPPPPPPAPEPVQQRPAATSTSSSAPAKKAPALAEEDDPFADIGSEEDLGGDAEPAPSRAAAPAAAPARSSYSSSSSTASAGTGGEALIFIASIPPVADVFLGDKLIGKTNVSELKIPAGTQTLRFVKGGKEITKQLTLQAGKNPSQMVRIP
jgi:anti-anti-sigma factor